ncbi:MAG: DUF11 domain-containing protein [Chloroflexi bacterium]|nr:DUF11 domain-containing protein [Chloroflexota bacterium]
MNLNRLFISIALGLALGLLVSSSWTTAKGMPDAGNPLPAYPLASGAWEQLTKLTASDGAADDAFGYAVALSGDIAIVGAEGVVSDTGAVYVFGRNAGGTDNWGQIAKLTASDGAEGDHFGCAVDISTDTIVVGANGDDGSGAVYVFDYSWSQTAKLVATDVVTADAFGGAVAISGDTIIVGAEGHDANGDNAGAAYVFDQGGTDIWSEIIKLTAGDGADDDAFGGAVDIISDTIVVGARYDDDNGTNSGSVYVFERNQGGADNWGQAAKLTPGDGDRYDYFGNAVALGEDANTLVVGAYEDNDEGDDSGSAYVFDRGGGGFWSQTAKLTADDGAIDDRLGSAVSVSGDTVAAGARYGNGALEAEAGAAYIFDRDSGGPNAWGQTAKLTADDGAKDDYFGHALVIRADTIIVGAYGDDDEGTLTGSAYVFIQQEMVDLSITKNVTPATAAPGETITYTIRFFNSGGADAANVVIEDSVPVSVTNTSVVSSGVPIVQRAHTRYIWDVPSLAQNEGGIITITGTLNPILAAGVFTNTVSITPTRAVDVEANASSNVGVTSVEVQNVAPVADDDGYLTSEDVVLTVSVPGVLAGDSDANGDPLTTILDSGPTNGDLALNADGSFTYTPTTNYYGPDSFRYHATDGTHNSNSATVTLTVLEEPIHTIYLPLILRQRAAPDLVVHSITATTDVIQVVIGNQGNAPTMTDFWVDVYVAPDPVPEVATQTWLHVADMGLVWDVWDTLYPGDTLTLTSASYAEPYSHIVWPLAKGTPIYAQVDSWNGAGDDGAVLENHELWGEMYNNINHTTVIEVSRFTDLRFGDLQ